MKKMLIPILMIVLALVLTGCASKTEADANRETSQPMTSPSGMDGDMTDLAESTPGMTDGLPDAMPGNISGTTNTMNGVTTAARARKAIQEIEEELERLSEVDEANVIVAGTTAVVALEFDKQYRAGVDQRMENMVKERIRSVVTGVENVIVTDDTGVNDTLRTLADRLDGEADMTGLEAELRKLIDRVKSMA